MKKLLVVLFIFFLKTTFAQEVRIPFRIGDKFGLSDEVGKLIVPAKFEAIKPIGYNFFETKKLKIDSVKNQPTRKIFSKGVIYNDLEIIKDETYSEFKMAFSGEFIIGTKKTGKSESTMLYNLKGEKLLSQAGRSIFFNDHEHIGDLAKSDSNLILISVVNRRKTSIAVYDRKKEKVTKWLIEGAVNYKRHKNLKDKSLAFITYYDPLPNEKYRYLAYNNVTNNFEVIPLSQKDETQYIRTYSYDEYQGITEAPEVEMMEENISLSNRILKQYMFIVENESNISYQEKVLPLIPEAKYLNLQRRQLNPIIYQLHDKFGIISSEISGADAIFDSLAYITKYKSFNHDQNQFLYLAGKLQGDSQKLKFGIIDQFGNEIIPMNFDTIHNFIPRITSTIKNKKGESITSIITDEYKKQRHLTKKKIDMINEFLFGIKDGQVFLINVNNRKIILRPYDAIFWINFPVSPPMELINADFIIKKGNKYGVADSINPNQDWIEKNIVFPFIPTHLISTYGEKKGFNLFKLVGKNGFFCFAREDGFLYYEK